MAIKPGQFCWYELMTSDPVKAVEFYTKVVGWSAVDFSQPGMPYTILVTPDGTRVAGVMGIPDEAKAMNVPPMWLGYIAVDDVDAYAAKVTAAGGSVKRPPTDIPTVGRFAVMADPDGAIFMLFKGDGEAPDVPTLPGKVGYVGWRELLAGDREGAFAFYSNLFGWSKDVAHEMGGDVGIYQTFKFETGDAMSYGGMMTKMAHIPWAFWAYYLNIEDINAAADRVKAHGGEVVMGPHEVPGNAWILVGRDPQGAMFSLIQAPK